MADFLPPCTMLNVGLSAFQGVVVLTSRVAEKLKPTPYSKFADVASKSKLVPSVVGMLILYGLPLAGSTFGFLRAAGVGGTYLVVAGTLVVHFLKRVLEAIFVHRYSGVMELAMAVAIGCYYCLASWIVRHSAALAPLHTSSLQSAAGVVLFSVGQLGNFYHHWRLRDLRSSQSKGAGGAMVKTEISGGRMYAIPTGGLFDFVTMPHYFCELVAWFGIFVIVPRLNVLLLCASFTSYLGGRSEATTVWYKEHFGSRWPAERRHLVPFMY
mmetsp:Transcript_67424/g.149391  ORF Transcript_67424/g.149391 Transcript_67424/m.149391 type:complete len:269 (-) Transcript_67424:107-913(-)